MPLNWQSEQVNGFTEYRAKGAQQRYFVFYDTDGTGLWRLEVNGGALVMEDGTTPLRFRTAAHAKQHGDRVETGELAFRFKSEVVAVLTGPDDPPVTQRSLEGQPPAGSVLVIDLHEALKKGAEKKPAKGPAPKAPRAPKVIMPEDDQEDDDGEAD